MCADKKNQVSPYDPTKLAIHFLLRLISNFGQNFKKTVSFDDTVHFIDEESITFYTETATKIRQINRDRNYISRSYEKPKCFPSNDQYNSSFDKQHSCIISLNPYNFWDVVPAALMSLNQTINRYSTSNQYPQPTINQPRKDSNPVFSSLRNVDSKKKDCPSPLLSSRKITYRIDEWTKQLPRLESWVNSGNPEQWTEFRQLCWTAIGFKCSYLFQLFVFYCLLVQFMFLFGGFTVFVHFPWSVWITSKSLSTTSMQGNTPLGSWSRNLTWYIAEVHTGVNHRCTPSSATTPYNLLQYLIRSLLCLIMRHDVIMNESLKPDYLSVYVANLCLQ